MDEIVLPTAPKQSLSAGHCGRGNILEFQFILSDSKGHGWAIQSQIYFSVEQCYALARFLLAAICN